jgi:hypothetical protein
MAGPAPFELAERVAEAARKLGIEMALIGASALAAHNYVRATDDVDLATLVDPRTELRDLQQALHDLGLHAELNPPDDEDVLGGLLGVWEHEDDQGRPLDLVEVVNFYNPFRPTPNPAASAIKNSVRVDEHTNLRYVSLPDLVALKLYAGGRQDLADIGELLVNNPAADRDEIRSVAGPYDRGGDLERLIAEAALRVTR